MEQPEPTEPQNWRALLSDEELAAFKSPDPARALRRLPRPADEHDPRLLACGREPSSAAISRPKGPAGSATGGHAQSHEVRPRVEPVPDGLPVEHLGDDSKLIFTSETFCDACGKRIAENADREIGGIRIVDSMLRDGRTYCSARCARAIRSLDQFPPIKLSPRLRRIAAQAYALYRAGLTQKRIAQRFSNQHRTYKQCDISRIIRAVQQANLRQRHVAHDKPIEQDAAKAA